MKKIKSRVNNSKNKIQEYYGKKIFFNKLGKKNKKKFFYLIRRKKNNGGIFGNFFFILQHLYNARRLKLIPIIDMQNFKTPFHDTDKRLPKNYWEYYFKPLNKYKLEEVYKSNNVLITCNTAINYTDNIYDLRNIFKKYIRLKDNLVVDIRKKLKKIGRKKYIGIFFRGGEYRFAAKHNTPPTQTQMLNHFNFIKKRTDIKFTYISSLVLNAFNFFKKEIDNSIYFDFYRSNSSNVLHDNNRKNHKYLLGKEIIEDSYLLSKSQLIIGSDSHILTFVRLLQPKKRIYIINNGRNTKKNYFNKLYWLLKSLLPNYLGGFSKYCRHASYMPEHPFNLTKI
jgi:hypothetical protein